MKAVCWVWLVTGGSRGLGLLLARQLAREGCRVTIRARDERELEREGEPLVWRLLTGLERKASQRLQEYPRPFHY